MSKIPAKPEASYPWWIRLIYFFQRRKYGQSLESAKIWARVPHLFWGVTSFYRALDRKSSPLDPVLRSLVTVRVSQINDCSFCVDLNSAIALERGGAREKVDDLEKYQESDKYSPKEKTALAYADAITYTDRSIDEKLWRELRSHFTEDEIVDLTGLIAFQNLSSKFNAALDIQPQGFCKVPPPK